MKAKHEQRRQSWRQTGASKPAGQSGSLKAKRVITTVILFALLLTAGWLTWSVSTSRYQHTKIASLFTASRTNTNEPERPFTLAPLRFSSESLAHLKTENTDEFQVLSLNSSFHDTSDLEVAISDLIDRLEVDDALILWIRAKGISIAGVPYLLNGDYRLPTSSNDLITPQGAVPLKSILAAVGQWSGPSLLLLDWGNQLVDGRAGMWENQFLPLAVQEVAACPPSVFCLVSHQPGQLSLESLAEKQAFFGNACAEALAGTRRVAADFQPITESRRQLLIGDLAEYVIRRVQADSRGLQIPWLIRGQHGWLDADRDKWAKLTSVPIVQLGNNGRPIKWPQSEDTSLETAAESKPPDHQPIEDSTQALSADIWPTGPLWAALDEWGKPSKEYPAWCRRTLAPITVRRHAAQILDLEAKWYAGRDFQGGSATSNLLSRIAALEKEIRASAEQIDSSSLQFSLAAVNAAKPSEVPQSEYERWKLSVSTVASFRELAILLTSAVSLADNLSRLEGVGVSTALNREVQEAILACGSFMTDTERDFSALSSVDPRLIRQRLLAKREAIMASVAELVKRVLLAPKDLQPVGEVLLRYPWLSPSQREQILRAHLTPNLSLSSVSLATSEIAEDPYWSSKDLVLLRPRTPSQSRSSRTLWSELIRICRDPGEPSLEREPTAGQIVDELAQAYRELSTAMSISERKWLAVDDRDLCQKEGGWPALAQQPPMPIRPAPIPQWRLVWENPRGGTLTNDQFRLESSTEPASVQLRLDRIGSADDVESIELAFTGLQLRLGGEISSWQRGRLNVQPEQLLASVDARTESKRLPIEFRAIGEGSNSARTLTVSVRAGASSPPERQLSFRLPISTPVLLTVEQLTGVDDQVDWKPCPDSESIVTLRPFGGRQTPYRFLLTNVDDRPRTASVELFALPPRPLDAAKGLVAKADGRLSRELEQINLATLKRIAVSKPLTLAVKRSGLVVDFSPAASTNEDAVERKGGSPASADISWGMLAAIRLQSEPNKTAEKIWIQIVPRRAIDFITAQSRVLPGSKAIEFRLKLRDTNADGYPDLIPHDLSAEDPINLESEIGGGLEMQRVTLPPMNRILTRELPEAVIVVQSSEKIQSEVELRVNVEDCPRAIMHFVGVDGRVGRREPPDRIWIQSIRVEGGLTYLDSFKRNYLENERPLKPDLGAIFRRPLANPIELQLAVDSETRYRLDAAPVPLELQITGNGWNHRFGRVFGDRDLSAVVAGEIDETLNIQCRLSDWRFQYPAEESGDFQALIESTLRDSRKRVIGKVVLDSVGPELSGTASLRNVEAGQNSQLSLEVRDVSPLAEGKILICPAGQREKNQQIGSGLSASDFLRLPDSWRLGPHALAVADLPPGQYEVRVELSDFVGNTNILGPWPLQIREPPKPTTGMKTLQGPVSGKLFFGTTKNRPPKTVTVRIKELPDKSTTSNDGNFTIENLEAGTYTIEATMTWQGTMYKAEKPIVLKNPKDWSRQLILSLARQ